MDDVSNLNDAALPKLDQLNAEQLLGQKMIITVEGVRRGSAEQKVIIDYIGDAGRPFKPCKTMIKALIVLWGSNGRDWIGRSMELFCDPAVKYGGVAVGGVRISAVSHIESDTQIMLTEARGKKKTHTFKKLTPQTPDTRVIEARQFLNYSSENGMAELVAAWGEIPADVKKIISTKGCPQEYKDKAKAADLAKEQAEAQE